MAPAAGETTGRSTAVRWLSSEAPTARTTGENALQHGNKTLRGAAAELLRELGPTHYRKLADQILQRGLATTSAKDPARSLNSTMSVDILRNGSRSEFVRVGAGVYGLRGLHAGGEGSAASMPGAPYPGASSVGTDLVDVDAHEQSRRVRIPLFPKYGEVRHVLKIWPGRPKTQITGLHSTLAQLRGTPQKPVVWTVLVQ